MLIEEIIIIIIIIIIILVSRKLESPNVQYDHIWIIFVFSGHGL